MLKVINKQIIAPLFKGCSSTFIQSYLQDYMGDAYVDNLDKPKSAKIVIGVFHFLAGQVNSELLAYKPESYDIDFAIMVPSSEEWQIAIEQHYATNANKITRYATKTNTQFNINQLQQIVAKLPKIYQLQMINKTWYQQIQLSDWAKDLCANFASYATFAEYGIGVVITKDNEIVAGASSYLVYNEGIEVEIDTKESERRKGLALVCGAKLILECINDDLYPNWDAHNKASLALAEKLGYSLDKEYCAYEIVGF